MPSPLTYPGVYIEEVPSGVRSITGVATSIALFIGWAARGRNDRAVRISSFADYQRTFGGLDRRTLLGHAVMQFFDNGGSDAYIVRLAGAGALASTAAIGDLTFHASSPGKWGDGYAVRTTRRQPPDDAHFTVDVLDKQNGNAIVESFQNVSMDKGDTRFVEGVINDRSGYIAVSAASGTTPADATAPLGGGDDGTLLQPGTAGFHAALAAVFGVGSITDRIDLFNLVCVPGETDAGALAALQTACRKRRAFLIADADSTATVALLGAGVSATLTGSDALNSALFFPWVRAADPLQQGAIASFPPCGFVAGVFARTDGARGVWKAPAGSDASLNGASGLAIAMSDAENGQLNPLGINCLRTLPVYGNVVWGARTLHGQNDRGSEWKYVPVRRMALFLEESLYRGTQWVVFEPNDEPLWAQIRLNVGAFLQDLFRQGAFQGRTPRDAYFVKCDGETTTQADINLGVVNILVGFAPLKPAEFVVLQLQQIAGDIPT
ncbi:MULTISPECIES: phage tail sheath C-terminal domain-containing protein [unclassified Burkholderia]|uniref:phage tail sheath family protein n=1 Tax=unclassified Burkholderia TaxID=2613784 RepID=UPI00075BF2DE|nr:MULTISPECIES: phage tail sheath C-terminal domain-containing protein [unclassified Burkholderia]KVN11803.1 phage tail protein [Burkholderia sp. MSMB1552]KWZ50701.1 phage tail protein [Burkholderia sp. MSMB1588]